MENKYYKWIFLEPNEYGIIQLLRDKIKNEWFYIHATTRKFPATEKDGVITGIFTFRT